MPSGVTNGISGYCARSRSKPRIATGGVLLFVHADTLLPPGALTAVAAVASQRGFVYGGFRHAFDGTDWRLRVVSALHNYRCARARTFYGDQALFVAPSRARGSTRRAAIRTCKPKTSHCRSGCEPSAIQR